MNKFFSRLNGYGEMDVSKNRAVSKHQQHWLEVCCGNFLQEVERELAVGVLLFHLILYCAMSSWGLVTQQLVEIHAKLLNLIWIPITCDLWWILCHGKLCKIDVMKGRNVSLDLLTLIYWECKKIFWKFNVKTINCRMFITEHFKFKFISSSSGDYEKFISCSSNWAK